MGRERAAGTAVGIAIVLAFGHCLGCQVFGPSGEQLLTQSRVGLTADARREALAALRGHAKPWMRQDLEAVLEHELDPATRALAAELLGAAGEAAAADALRAALHGDAQPLVRQRALSSLAALLGEGSLDDVRYALTGDADPQVRALAADLAGKRLRREAALPLLLDALQDKSPLVRVKAQQSLEKLTGLSAPPDRQSWEKALSSPPASPGTMQ
jgi:HEAT repeat protein